MLARRWNAALVALIALPLFACGGRQVPEEMDVSRVVLYQSGVAYIERTGEFRGDELVIPIRPEQINDVLTSLVVIDRGRSSTTSVSLPIDMADVQNVYDLPPELRNAGGLYSVLSALRGADVVIRTGGGRLRGRVVGVETVGGEQRVTVLRDGDELATVDVEDIDQVRVENESIAMAIDRSLDQSSNEGDWRPIEVSIHFDDPGSHDIMMAYVVEMPIWKPAYRVVVTGDERLLLQGWAVVDNTSGEDWDDIQLSLTAGTPISFRYDIHSPIYIQRPDMTGYGVPEVADLRPPTPMQSTPMPAPSPEPEIAGGFGRSGGGSAYGYDGDEEVTEEDYWDDLDMLAEAPEEDRMPRRSRDQRWTGDDIATTSGTSADVSDVGALFRFDIPGDVTVPDQSSTLVTLMNTEIDGEDALVYQPEGGSSSSHPYRSLLLENSTEFPIQPAPIAIYADATFVGEGITPTVNPGETAFIPYALEQRVQVDERVSTTTGETTLARIVDGQIYVEQESVRGSTFEISNSLGEEMRIYVQVSRWSGYELIGSDDPDIRTHPGYYLIPRDVESGGETSFTIEQNSTQVTQIDVFSSNFPDVLSAYLSDPDARPDVAERLRPIQEMIGELQGLEQQLDEQREMRSDVQIRTAELRANIQTLGDSERNADLRQQLVGRLAEQEAIMDEVTGRIVELQEEQSALRVRITESLRDVTLQRE